MEAIHEQLADGTSLYGWKSESPLTPFAPSYAHYLTEKKIFSEEECKEWNDYLLKQEPILFDEYEPKGDGKTGYCDLNLLQFDFHLVEHLKTAVFDGVCQLLEISGNKSWQQTLYAHSWFNVLRQGDGMDMHSHGYNKNSFLGFHLTVCAKDTFTTFFHPVKFQEEYYNAPNNIGHLTLFPDFIPHGVTPNNHEIPRISIAGDIYTESWLDENSVILYNSNEEQLGGPWPSTTDVSSTKLGRVGDTK
jgi:hypothetical protein